MSENVIQISKKFKIEAPVYHWLTLDYTFQEDFCLFFTYKNTMILFVLFLSTNSPYLMYFDHLSLLVSISAHKIFKPCGILAYGWPIIQL